MPLKASASVTSTTTTATTTAAVTAATTAMWSASGYTSVGKAESSAHSNSCDTYGGFIDIDLVKGSTFPKNKSRQGLANIVLNGLLKLVFLPFYLKW